MNRQLEQRGTFADTDFISTSTHPGGFIDGVMQSNVQPSSVDLTISDEIYEVRRDLFPYPDMTIKEMLPTMKAERRDINEPLWVNCMYLIKLRETLQLPQNHHGRANPKSSIGRVNLHVRLMADRTGLYDTVPMAYHGDLWVLVVARSFSVKIYEGMPIINLRVFYGKSEFSQLDLERELERQPLLYNPDGTPIDYLKHAEENHFPSDGSVMTTLYIPKEGIAGYYCIANPERVLDLSPDNVGKIDPQRFFEPVDIIGGGNMMYKHYGGFYILSIQERLLVPPHLAAEMVSIQPELGHFISHIAGFIDAGWGAGEKGDGNGRPITLEATAFLKEGMTLRSGQPIGRFTFQKMLRLPERHYDQINSNYQGQNVGPKLAKWFKPWPE